MSMMSSAPTLGGELDVDAVSGPQLITQNAAKAEILSTCNNVHFDYPTPKKSP